MKHSFWVLNIIFATLIMAGCSTSHQQASLQKIELLPEINTSLFDSSEIKVTNEQDLFLLSDKQKTKFLTYYNKRLAKGVKPHQALSDFLQNRLSNFTYNGKTFVAEKSMRLNRGNCMSLAILTTALAKVVNLDVDYREVNTLPIFEKHTNIVLSSSHVQAVIYDPEFIPNENTFYINKPAITIDYFPINTNRVNSKILKDSLVAKYYINIAAAALVENDLNRAFSYAEKAYHYDKSSAQIANLLAVLHRKTGDEVTAENFYQQALKQNKNSLVLLQNYAILLSSQQRFEELNNVDEQIDDLYDPNPYRWLEQAYIAQQRNYKRKAEKYFLKVINMAPYVHQAYLGLYQVYSASGQKQKAKRILKKGLEWTYEQTDRQRYKGKLYSLNNT